MKGTNHNMNTYNCLLCGVGGQGTVLASKLIAYAAMQKNMNVRTSETIGMAQRGGSVVSHVRCGDKINSPLIAKHTAQVLIAFEPGEAVRCLDYLAPDGVVIVNNKAVMPITSNFGAEYNGNEMFDYLKKNVKHLIIVDGNDICEKCNSSKVLNIALLAVAAKTNKLSISIDELKNAIKCKIPAKFHDMNIAAVDYAVQKYM